MNGEWKEALPTFCRGWLGAVGGVMLRGGRWEHRRRSLRDLCFGGSGLGRELPKGGQRPGVVGVLWLATVWWILSWAASIGAAPVGASAVPAGNDALPFLTASEPVRPGEPSGTGGSKAQTTGRRATCYLAIGNHRLVSFVPVIATGTNPPPTPLLGPDPEGITDVAIAAPGVLRWLRFAAASRFAPAPDPLIRQVFDGSARTADWGHHSGAHRDGRSEVQPEGARPIYRPLGSPYAVGPGERCSGPPPESLPPGEIVFPGKTWYRIPNNSWYQTWYTASATGAFSRSHLVFFDRREIRPLHWLECGSPMGSDSVEVGSIDQERVIRFALNGCLETCGGVGGCSLLGFGEPLTASTWIPSSNGFAVYAYFAQRPRGRIIGPAAGSGTLVVESASYGRRWLGVLPRPMGGNWWYVIGDDVLSRWWSGSGQTGPAPVAHLVAFAPDERADRTHIFVYDRIQGRIWRFDRDEGAGTAIPPVLVWEGVGPALDDLKTDADGNLFLTRRTTSADEPVVVLDDGIMLGKALHGGRVVFRRRVEEEIWMMPRSGGPGHEVGVVPLGESFAARAFRLPSPARPPTGKPLPDWEKRIQAARGLILDRIEGVPEFPDTYFPPTLIRLAVR